MKSLVLHARETLAAAPPSIGTHSPQCPGIPTATPACSCCTQTLFPIPNPLGFSRDSSSQQPPRDMQRCARDSLSTLAEKQTAPGSVGATRVLRIHHGQGGQPSLSPGQAPGGTQAPAQQEVQTLKVSVQNSASMAGGINSPVLLLSRAFPSLLLGLKSVLWHRDAMGRLLASEITHPPPPENQALLPWDESDLGKALPHLPGAGESSRDQPGHRQRAVLQLPSRPLQGQGGSHES